MSRRRTSRSRQRGQAMSEFVILLVLLAIGSILLSGATKQSISDVYLLASAEAGQVDGGSGGAASASPGSSSTSDGPCPYYWNPATERWHDPSNNQFVSNDAAGGAGCSY